MKKYTLTVSLLLVCLIANAEPEQQSVFGISVNQRMSGYQAGIYIGRNQYPGKYSLSGKYEGCEISLLDESGYTFAGELPKDTLIKIIKYPLKRLTPWSEGEEDRSNRNSNNTLRKWVESDSKDESNYKFVSDEAHKLMALCKNTPKNNAVESSDKDSTWAYCYIDLEKLSQNSEKTDTQNLVNQIYNKFKSLCNSALSEVGMENL